MKQAGGGFKPAFVLYMPDIMLDFASIQVCFEFVFCSLAAIFYPDIPSPKRI